VKLIFSKLNFKTIKKNLLLNLKYKKIHSKKKGNLKNFWIFLPLKKRIWRYGSKDPDLDPYHNVTVPEHWKIPRSVSESALN